MSFFTNRMNTENFKKKLEEEKKVLLEELGTLGKKNPEDGEWEATVEGSTEADRNDLGDRFEDFEEKSSMINPLEKRLTDVTDALKKIQDGTYGICETSGEPIEEERLEANPAARTCIKHME